MRKVSEGETVSDLYAFLTTEPNAEVAPIHPPQGHACNTNDAGGMEHMAERRLVGSQGLAKAAGQWNAKVTKRGVPR